MGPRMLGLQKPVTGAGHWAMMPKGLFVCLFSAVRTCFPGMYCWCSLIKGIIIICAVAPWVSLRVSHRWLFIDRWSDYIGLDRDRLPSWRYQPSQYTSHTMKSSDPLLLADGTLRCGMSLGKVAISRHLITLGVPPVWPYCRQAQCERWRSLKWSIADLLSSSHPHMSTSHLLGLQVRANGPLGLQVRANGPSWCPKEKVILFILLYSHPFSKWFTF